MNTRHRARRQIGNGSTTPARTRLPLDEARSFAFKLPRPRQPAESGMTPVRIVTVQELRPEHRVGVWGT